MVRKELKDRIASVADLDLMVEALIIKTTVATEVPWFVSRMVMKTTNGKPAKMTSEEIVRLKHRANAAVIKAMDYPAAWWKQNGSLPLADLLVTLIETAEKDAEANDVAA